MTTTPTERRLAITPGEVSEYAGFITTRDHEGDLVILAGMIRHGKRGFAEVNSSPFGGFQDGFTYATKEENAANAALYADAHNTANACGLTPSELLAELTKLRSERDELVGALGALLEGRKNDAYGTAWSEAREVFAKHKPE